MEHNDLAWYAVVNPHAGTGKLLPKWKMAEDLMRCKGIDCRYMSTDCRFHATELTCSAAEEGFRRFIAVGGDGTAHEILDGIMHYISDVRLKGGSVSLSDFTLAVVPIGSGNDWIKSHHIPYDVGEVVDMISAGSFSGQDIVKVTSSVCDGSVGPGGISYMINIGGAGLDAMICERVNRQKDRGKSGRLLYVNSLIYNLVHSENFSVEVVCDGMTVYKGKCLSIAFGIGRYSGGGFRQTPDAVMDDGLLDVTVIPPLKAYRIPGAARRLIDGTFLRQKEVLSFRAGTVEVLPSDGRHDIVEVDGEITGTLPVRLEVLPDRINVLHRD